MVLVMKNYLFLKLYKNQLRFQYYQVQSYNNQFYLILKFFFVYQVLLKLVQTNELSNFYLEGKLNDWTYSTNYRSINRNVISDGQSREQLSYVISKEFENLKTSYSTTYDLNNGKNENVSENFKIEYTEKGYMFGNCLTIGLQYKSEGAINDRDIISEDSLFLTFSFRNLGDAK